MKLKLPSLRTILAVACVVALALVGFLDYVTGPWMSFTLLYVVPVLAASWWLGRVPAFVAAVASSACWFAAETWGHRNETLRVLSWNSGSRLVLLVLMAAMIVRIRGDQQRLRAINRRLAELLGDAERLARTDPLTGLANARAFVERLRQELARAQRDHTPLALAYIDIDNFKRINDARGHPAGDELLRTIAEAIRETVRASDVAARLGGDEFAVLFVGAREGAVEAAAQRLLARLVRIADTYSDLHLGASIGMALYPTPAATPEEMIRAADAAMYEAKRRGKGRVVLSQPAALAEATSPATH